MDRTRIMSSVRVMARAWIMLRTRARIRFCVSD